MNDFRDIKGNGQIIKSMKAAIDNNMVSHAYIIGGAEGSGKKTLAAAFAKTLLCRAEGDDACNKCVSCRTFDSGNNPDVRYVYPAKTKSVSVDDVREQISADVKIKPYSGKYKIYIIPKADMLTEQAQNALLKTLEEPPEYAVFMLLAENTEMFLPTVLSRCVVFGIKPLPAETVKNYIIENGIADEKQAAVCAEYAQGSIGAAVRFARSEQFAALKTKVISTLSDMDSLSLFDLTQAAAELEEFKDLTDVTDMIYIWYRDVLAYKTMQNDSRIIEKDIIPLIKKESDKISMEGLYNIPQYIIETKKQIRQNVNFVFAMEMLFINIKESYSDDRSNRSKI